MGDLFDEICLEKLTKELVLRGYQLDLVDLVRKSIMSGHKRILLQLWVGGGKTIISAEIMKLAAAKFKKSLFVAPRRQLVYQTSETFTEYGINNGMIMAGEQRFNQPLVQVGSIDTITCRMKSGKIDLPQADFLIVDECFTGDVEILTENGFIRFDDLDYDLKVAQYDGGYISFVSPDRHIKNKFSGELVKFKSDKLIDVTLTKGHDLLVACKDKETGNIEDKKIKADKLNLSSLRYLYVAGKAIGNDNILSNVEKLMICLQADGCITLTNAGKKILQFSFSKQRKIDSFLSLMEDGGFRYDEVKGQEKKGNQKNTRRFTVKDIDYSDKDVYKFFNISDISYEKAKSIIEYMVIWDGNINNKTGQYYFSSTNEKVVDFYQTVGILAGYKTNKTLQIDDRSEKFNDIFRLFISKNCNTIGTQQIEKSTVNHDGFVYCVTVPSGNIIIRRSGKPLVIGNCHAVFSKDRLKVLDRYKIVIGITSTPALANGKGMGSFYTDMVQGPTMKEMVGMGFLVPMVYFGADAPDLAAVKLNADGDYQEKGLAEASDKPELIGAIYKNYRKIAGDRSTLIFAVNRKHGQHIYQEFLSHGIKTDYIDGNTETKERDAIKERVMSGETKVVVNIVVMAFGVDWSIFSCVIIARVTRNISAWIQMIGRGSRLHPSKKDCIVIYHGSNFDELGRIDDDIQWSLDDKTTVKERKEKKQKESKEAKDVVCRNCSFVFRSMMSCPRCGCTMIAKGSDIPTHEAELIELVKKEKYSEDYKQDFFEQMIGYARRNSKSDYWAINQYESRFKETPKWDKKGREPGQEVANWIKHINIRNAYSKRKSTA